MSNDKDIKSLQQDDPSIVTCTGNVTTPQKATDSVSNIDEDSKQLGHVLVKLKKSGNQAYMHKKSNKNFVLNKSTSVTINGHISPNNGIHSTSAASDDKKILLKSTGTPIDILISPTVAEKQFPSKDHYQRMPTEVQPIKSNSSTLRGKTGVEFLKEVESKLSKSAKKRNKKAVRKKEALKKSRDEVWKLESEMRHVSSTPTEASSHDGIAGDIVNGLSPSVKDNFPHEKAEAAPAEPPTPNKPADDVKRMEEELGLRQAEERLQRDHIVPVRKVKDGAGFSPFAKYHCNLCAQRIASVVQAHKHIKSKRHRKLCKEKQEDEELRNLPIPPDCALDALDNLLLDTVLNNGEVLDSEDLATRKEVVRRLDAIISKAMKDFKVVMYGSSLTGCGFKTSDINVDLQFPANVRSPNALLRVLHLLQSSDEYKDVESSFHSKIPHIEMREAGSGLRIELSTGNELASSTSQLLRFYIALDRRVFQLGMVFRKWARLCRLDRQKDGSLPAHTFLLMAIFFMQRNNYLPVLHELIAEHDLAEIVRTATNCPQLVRKADSWWYLPTDDPAPNLDQSAAGGAKDSDEDSANPSDFESELDTSVSPDDDHPVVFATSSPPTSIKPLDLTSGCVARDRKIGELWLGLLKFFALEFSVEDMVITIRQSGPVTRAQKNWSRKRIAVVDPYLNKRNLCRSMTTPVVFNYMMERLRAAFTYFHLADGKRASSAIKPSDDDVTDKSFDDDDGDDITKTAVVGEIISDILANLELDDAGECDVTMTSSSQNKYAKDSSPETKESDGDKGNVDSKKSSSNAVTSSSSRGSEDRVSGKISYEFSAAVLTGGEYPVVVCGLCKREGHPRDECPEDGASNAQDLVRLPPVSPRLRNMLDRFCCLIYEHSVPSKQEEAARNEICHSLTAYLQHKYKPTCRMFLFGSSRNGFGFRGSDLDICMMFDDNPTGQDLRFGQIIEEVGKCMRKNPELRSILPITTAKVPIVKFEHRASRLEGDVSLYNILAQRNTAMLQCYSKIDHRCRVLGYAMKAFVKRCCVGDASRGSLSSYAYTLMVVYFLQQRDPPVLPVLQELHETDKKPVHLVDGWNAWFFQDLNNLHKVWPEHSMNQESVGELWLGLLRFYTEDFDFRKTVVCIRQRQPLTVFEKEWTAKFISIEDPFDLSHNLGAGVSRKMTNFIQRVFIRARERFGVEPTFNLHVRVEVEYFLDVRVLMNGEEAPNDGCCRLCGKIGHYVRDCPRNKRRRRQDNDNGGGKDDDELRCFHCNGSGHFKKDCPQLKHNSANGGKPGRNSRQQQPVASGEAIASQKHSAPATTNCNKSTVSACDESPVRSSSSPNKPLMTPSSKQMTSPYPSSPGNTMTSPYPSSASKHMTSPHSSSANKQMTSLHPTSSVTSPNGSHAKHLSPNHLRSDKVASPVHNNNHQQPFAVSGASPRRRLDLQFNHHLLATTPPGGNGRITTPPGGGGRVATTPPRVASFINSAGKPITPSKRTDPLSRTNKFSPTQSSWPSPVATDHPSHHVSAMEALSRDATRFAEQHKRRQSESDLRSKESYKHHHHQQQSASPGGGGAGMRPAYPPPPQFAYSPFTHATPMLLPIAAAADPVRCVQAAAPQRRHDATGARLSSSWTPRERKRSHGGAI